MARHRINLKRSTHIQLDSRQGSASMRTLFFCGGCVMSLEFCCNSICAGRKKLVATASILLFLVGILGKPAFGDSLTVLGGPPGGNCTQTVTSGSATISCSNPANGDVATASGNLAAGTFGVSTTVNPPSYLFGSSSSALVTIGYDFSVGGAQSGTADFDLAIDGLLMGSTSGCTGPPPGSSCAFENAYLYYPGLEAISIGGVPGPAGALQLGSGITNLIVGTNITNGSTELTLQLFVGASCSDIFDTCSANADFLDPASITGASVYDSNGNLVSGASLVSESGFNPNAAGPVQTSEPSSLLLLTAGVFGLMALAKLKAITA